ncbi:hypothetical protein ES703_105442 [subsurface metagenome]
MTKEYEELKEALRKEPTPEAMQEAAQRFRKFEATEKLKGKRNSRPTLVSLSRGKDYPVAVPLDQVHQEIARNPAYFNLLKRVITKER